MGKCFVFHDWDGCVCRKCGKTRDNGHDYAWSSLHGQCCAVCTKCGKVADRREHTWEIIPGACRKKCTRCGRTETTEHTFVKMEGVCREKCTVCGLKRQTAHQFRRRYDCRDICVVCGYEQSAHRWNRVRHGRKMLDGCKCEVCGAINEGGEHDWKYGITEGGYTDIKICCVCGKRDESGKITLEEAERRERRREEMYVNMDEGIINR